MPNWATAGLRSSFSTAGIGSADYLTSSTSSATADAQSRLAERARSSGKLTGARAVLPPNPVIEAIVLKALAKERDHRYQTAEELSHDIIEYLGGRPTSVSG